MADRLRARPHRALPRGEPDAHGLPITASAGLGHVLTGEDLTGRAEGIELVRLGTDASGGPRRAIDLHDPLALLEQLGRQAGAEPAGPLDRPDPAARRMLVGEGKEPLVPEAVVGDCQMANHSPGRRDDRRGVRLRVGIDPEDNIDPLCQLQRT